MASPVGAPPLLSWIGGLWSSCPGDPVFSGQFPGRGLGWQPTKGSTKRRQAIVGIYCSQEEKSFDENEFVSGGKVHVVPDAEAPNESFGGHTTDGWDVDFSASRVGDGSPWILDAGVKSLPRRAGIGKLRFKRPPRNKPRGRTRE